MNAVTEVTRSTERQLAELTRTVDQQRTTIEALIAAAERRTASEPDSAAIATWQRNLTLQRRVTERTNRVRVAERLLRSVIDSLDAGLCILAADGSIVDTNRVWKQMLSAQADGAGTDPGCFFTLGRTRTGGLGELLRDAAVSVAEVLAGGAPESGIERPIQVGTEQRWWKAQVDPVRGHDAAQAVVTVTDVTRQVRTAEELRQATKDASRLALVARHMDDAVVIADEHGVIEWVNDAFTQMTGYPAEEVLGRVRTSLEVTQPIPVLSEVTSPDGEFVLPEMLTQTKDGRPYWLKVELFRVTDDDGVVRFVGVERDVTARREAEETLLEAMGHAEALAQELSTEKAVLTGVISSIPHLTYWKDFAGRYHGHNAAFLAMREVPPGANLLGRTEPELGFTDQLSGILVEIEKQVLQNGQPVVDQQITIARPDGATRTVLMSVLPQPDATGQLGGLIGVGADVTRVSELERQLNQTNRLEAIGQLAAGIAHEINTPIQFVSDNARFVAQSLTPLLNLATLADRSCAEPARDPAEVVAALRPALAGVDVDFLVEELPSALNESLEGLERVAQIVRAMKDFSHPGQGRSAIDLNRAIESTVQVARNEWKYCAELDLCLSPDVDLVPGAEPMRVHIRVLPGQLRHPGLIEDLAQTLILSGLEPHRLTLEVPQTHLADGPSPLAQLETITEWGVRLALVVEGPAPSAAGAGLPFGAVKMNVSGATHDPGDAEARSTVETAVEIARGLAAPLIAGDVDCAECQATARTWGCEFGQGTLYGPPADPGELLPGLVAGRH